MAAVDLFTAAAGALGVLWLMMAQAAPGERKSFANSFCMVSVIHELDKPTVRWCVGVKMEGGRLLTHVDAEVAWEHQLFFPSESSVMLLKPVDEFEGARVVVFPSFRTLEGNLVSNDWLVKIAGNFESETKEETMEVKEAKWMDLSPGGVEGFKWK